MIARPRTCFFENDPTLALARRATVEAIGTLLLMFAAVAASLSMGRYSPDASAIGSVANALVGPGVLVGMILAFGAVSGGHFNPLITGLQWLGGERSANCTLAYVGAQLLGALCGAWLATEILRAPRLTALHSGKGWPLLPSEIVATAGLLLIVQGCARSGRADSGPFGVGLWLSAIAIAVPSSRVNPALTVAALVIPGHMQLSPRSVLNYLPSQFIGALIAFLVIRAAYPDVQPKAAASSANLPMSHSERSADPPPASSKSAP